MATNKNITMKQFNGVDYDTLYPKTIASQIDDVYSKDEMSNLFLPKAGGSMGGILDMNGNRITNLPTPTSNSEPATKGYVDGRAIQEITIFSGTKNITSNGVEIKYAMNKDTFLKIYALLIYGQCTTQELSQRIIISNYTIASGISRNKDNKFCVFAPACLYTYSSSSDEIYTYFISDNSNDGFYLVYRNNSSLLFVYSGSSDLQTNLTIKALVRQ